MAEGGGRRTEGGGSREEGGGRRAEEGGRREEEGATDMRCLHDMHKKKAVYGTRAGQIHVQLTARR